VGAAELALDADLSSEPLARRILALVDDDERRTTMAAAALAWATPDADQRLADLVHEVGR
jgi:UDP-N-acetylglucosamine:LPS N-acetylglucosamine transferase